MVVVSSTMNIKIQRFPKILNLVLLDKYLEVGLVDYIIFFQIELLTFEIDFCKLFIYTEKLLLYNFKIISLIF